MQRRVATSSSSGPSAGSASSAPSPSRFHRRNQHSKKRKFNPVILLIGVAVTIMCLSWWLFPDEVVKVEHEAEYVGHQLAEQAIRAEHNVEDWIQHRKNSGGGSPSAADRSASEAASAAMLAQSSNWVEGEKKLKKKLAELYDKQQKGELLGVPVLTRWMGDDFPAWVTPDMDEKQWRQDVAAKYKEMREEEERWKLEMEKVIEQRERDLGITTP
jgi:hypothetical protein